MESRRVFFGAHLFQASLANFCEFGTKGQAFDWLLWFSDCAACQGALQPLLEEEEEEGRRTGAVAAVSCTLWPVPGRVQLAASYGENFKRSGSDKLIAGFDFCVLCQQWIPNSIWIFVLRNASKYDWCLALRTLPSFRTTNRNTKPNHQWSKVACHCISDIKSINHYKVASTVALAEWFARHEDLHMNIWRSMPIWFVQTKRSHWSI